MMSTVTQLPNDHNHSDKLCYEGEEGSAAAAHTVYVQSTVHTFSRHAGVLMTEPKS